MAILAFPRVAHRYLDVDGIRVFYRESIPAQTGPDAPVLLLLHGFPSASHQFRRLIDAIGNSYRVIAPDYPGFGHSDVPLPTSAGGTFGYSFDRLADTMEGFVKGLRLDRFLSLRLWRAGRFSPGDAASRMVCRPDCPEWQCL